MGNADNLPPPTLIDVTDHTMRELLASGDREVVESVQRLLDELRHRKDVLLGWSSAYVGPATAEQDRPPAMQ